MQVYVDIAADCPELEDEGKYEPESVIEIIRDANRVSMAARERRHSTNLKVSQLNQEFYDWLQQHEYDPAYKKDMDALVHEAIYGAAN